MFTVHNIKTDGTLSNKECLNNDELDQWLDDNYGRFANLQVVQDLTGKKIVLVDGGEYWEKV